MDKSIYKAINDAAAAEGGVTLEAVAATAKDPSENELDITTFLGTYRPPKTFDVTFPDGRVWQFRAFERISEREAWEKKFAEWFKYLPSRDSAEAKAEEWNTPDPETGEPVCILPANASEASYAHLIAETIISPKIPIKSALALNLAADAMKSIQRQLDKGNKNVYRMYLDKAVSVSEKKSGDLPDTDNS